MSNGQKHLSRKELLKAAQAGKIKAGSHLDKCVLCQTYFNLLTEFTVVGAQPLETPSDKLMAKLHKISDSPKPTKRKRIEAGEVVFDSWQGLAPSEYRDRSENTVRRMKLSAGAICLELVAERQSGQWSFVAKLYDSKKATSDFTILIGRRKFGAESLGYYQWSSTRPPSKLKLQSDVATIEFKGLTW
jgi:hypothetical protein